MKIRIPFRILFLTMALLLFTMGCQEEDFIETTLDTEQVDTVTQEEGPKADVVMGEDIPDIVESIASKTATTYSKVADLEGKIRFNNAMIHMHHARRVKNKSGVINYTFDLFPDDAPENAFYTLIVSKAKNGTLDDPYVIGYEMTDADFENFMAHDMDFRYFRAEQRFYNFDSFFIDSKNNRVGKSGDCGSNTIGSGGGGGYIAPGETFSFTFNNTMVNTTFGTSQNAGLYNYHLTIGDSGATGSTTSVTANSSDFTVTNPAFTTPPQVVTLPSSTVTVHFETDSNDSGSGSGGSPCFKGNSVDGFGTFIFYEMCPPTDQLKGGTTSKGTDCIVVNGGVSISVNLAVKKIFVALDGKLSDSQLSALMENNAMVIDIYNFLQTNTSEEDKAFVIEAIKAIEKGGSVFLEEDGLWHAACRSFEYANLGSTGTKVAAVKGIEHPVLRTDRCPGVGYVFPQPTYYFTLPSWKPRAQKVSAMALERAFDKLEEYFKNDIPCLPNGQSYIGLLSSKLLEFTKEEFTKIGGAASKYPPAGWNGEEHDYETNVGMLVPDC